MTSSPTPPAAHAGVVVGLDIGGSSTKAVVLDADGQVLSHARTAGGNHRSTGADVSARLRTAVAAALGPIAPGDVRAVAAGIAGAGSAAGREVADRVTSDLAQIGVVAPLQVGTDLDIAFLAGSPAGDGVLLLSGTGAVGARYRSRDLVRRCDGLGWRLGDEGSGHWIGARALRAGVAALDGRGPQTLLTELVGAALDVGDLTGDPRQDWVRAAADLDVPRTAALVPAVLTADQQGDAVARGILTEAAERLLTTFAVVAEGDRELEVVLAGGVLTTSGHVSTRVREALDEEGHRVQLATDPVLGSLLLAADVAGWPPLDPLLTSLPPAEWV